MQHLEELILEECHGIDDEGLEALKRNCKRNSLKVHSFVFLGIPYTVNLGFLFDGTPRFKLLGPDFMEVSMEILGNFMEIDGICIS